MATAKKTHFRYVVITRFYTPKDLAEIYGMDQKRLIDQATIAGALYQIGTKKLINRVRIEQFLKKRRRFHLLHGWQVLSDEYGCETDGNP